MIDDPRLSLLTAQHRHDALGRLATDRTVEYMRWRYAMPPGLEYRAIWDLSFSGTAAVISRGRLRGSLREISLSEVLIGGGPGSISAAGALVRQLAREADADYLVAVASPHTKERRVLAKAGFVPAFLGGPLLCLRALEKRLSGLRVTAFRLSLGDIEVF
jgi:hypothetical protein